MLDFLLASRESGKLLHAFANFLPRHTQLIELLQVQPKLRVDAKPVAKTQRGVRRDTALVIDDSGDPIDRYGSLQLDKSHFVGFGIATQSWYRIIMKRDEAIRRLRQHEADLKRLGVEHLYMFGSTARGEAKEDSDVDLFFDYERGRLGLFELMDVKEYAASILGHKTDIMTRDSLHKTLRQQIEETATRVF
jgi:uncharacterized protein